MLSYLSYCSSIHLFLFVFFFFNDTATTEIYTLSLHDALPIWLMISLVKRRVIRCSSRSDICFGLHTTPPFAPPKGIPASAHFHVIHIARDLTSSSVTSG